MNDSSTSEYYIYERGIDIYNWRPTVWTGKIGLMYPSDYEYATSGGSIVNRKNCLEMDIHSWKDFDYCKDNDWLFYDSNLQWTITHRSNSPNYIVLIYLGGIGSGTPSSEFYVFPTIYLKSNVRIISGTGSSMDPYILSVD